MSRRARLAMIHCCPAARSILRIHVLGLLVVSFFDCHEPPSQADLERPTSYVHVTTRTCVAMVQRGCSCCACGRTCVEAGGAFALHAMNATPDIKYDRHHFICSYLPCFRVNFYLRGATQVLAIGAGSISTAISPSSTRHLAKSHPEAKAINYFSRILRLVLLKRFSMAAITVSLASDGDSGRGRRSMSIPVRYACRSGLLKELSDSEDIDAAICVPLRHEEVEAWLGCLAWIDTAQETTTSSCKAPASDATLILALKVFLDPCTGILRILRFHMLSVYNKSLQ